VLLTVANALSSNLEKVEKKSIIEKVETLFFPQFWEQKGVTKFTNLFFN
jgi:hypothetical protein